MSQVNFGNITEIIICTVSFHSLPKKDISRLYGVTTFTSVVNSFTALAAVVSNLFAILAIGRTPSLRCPSNILLCCLAVTDLLNGLVVQPLLVMLNVSRIQGNHELYCIASTGFSVPFGVLCTVSFLTLTLVNVDRLLAIKYPLRYNEFVTNKRVFMAAIFCWIFCSIDLLFKLKKYYRAHFIFFFFVLVLGMAVSFTAYCNIFRVIKRHKLQMKSEERLSVRLQGNSRNNNTNSELREKKNTMTMAYLSLLFLLCYIPYVPVSITNAVYSGKPFPLPLRIAGNVTVTLILVNSALNPLFYCYRLRNIRRAVLQLFGIRCTSRVGPKTPQNSLSNNLSRQIRHQENLRSLQQCSSVKVS